MSTYLLQGGMGEDIIQPLAGENKVGTGEKQRVAGMAGAEWRGEQWSLEGPHRTSRPKSGNELALKATPR